MCNLRYRNDYDKVSRIEIEKFNEAIGDCLASFNDGSLKVGIQGLDSNRWRIHEILAVLEVYVEFARTVKRETGKNVAPIDIWGGGQVSQISRFLGEDPFENLLKMKRIAPDLIFKCIYRGRQAFGFLPCSDEVQRLTIFEAAASGIQIFRMFDPMNDARNLKAGLNAVKEYRQLQIRRRKSSKKLVSAEALVFYVFPPEKSRAVWTDEQIINYSIELAKMGFHEISLADYAEQIPNPETAENLIRKIRIWLNRNGFYNVNVNFFAQGNRPDINKAALAGGAKTVDVAIGLLSGGLSNTDIFLLLKMMMMEKGFDIEDPIYSGHPVLVKLKKVELLINKISKNHIPYRMSFDLIDRKDISHSRLAFNAVSALYSAIQKNWEILIKRSLPKEFIDTHGLQSQIAYLKEILRASYKLWIDAGQFHPVSPFGYICSFQAESLVRTNLAGRVLPIGHYRREFQDLVKGRYGKNLGVEREICDIGLIKSFHMYEVLEIIKDCLIHNSIKRDKLEEFFLKVGLSDDISIESDIVSDKIGIMNIENSEKLENVLRKTCFETFRRIIKETDFNKEINFKLGFAVSSERFSNILEGIKEGRRIIDQLIKYEKLEFSNFSGDNGRLSEKDRAALSIVLYKVDSHDAYAIGKNLYRHIQHPQKKLYGDIEPNTRPFDVLLKTEISSLGKIIAKEKVLKNIQKQPYLSAKMRIKNIIGLEKLDNRKQLLVKKAIEKLYTDGYCETLDFNHPSIKYVLELINSLSEQCGEKDFFFFTNIIPATWIIDESM
jgi:hypothetical protein